MPAIEDLDEYYSAYEARHSKPKKELWYFLWIFPLGHMPRKIPYVSAFGRIALKYMVGNQEEKSSKRIRMLTVELVRLFHYQFRLFVTRHYPFHGTQRLC